RDSEFDTKRPAGYSTPAIPMQVGNSGLEIEAIAALALDDAYLAVVNSPASGFDAGFDLFSFPPGDAYRAIVGVDVHRRFARYVIGLMPLIRLNGAWGNQQNGGKHRRHRRNKNSISHYTPPKSL